MGKFPNHCFRFYDAGDIMRKIYSCPIVPPNLKTFIFFK